MYVIAADCAWTDCEATGPLTKNINTNKIIKLPCCSEHENVIAIWRNIYKNFSELTSTLKSYLNDETISIKDRIRVLKNIQETLTEEVNARAQQTQNIKPIYRNQAHSE